MLLHIRGLGVDEDWREMQVISRAKLRVFACPLVRLGRDLDSESRSRKVGETHVPGTLYGRITWTTDGCFSVLKRICDQGT